MAHLFNIKTKHNEGSKPLPPGSTFTITWCCTHRCRPDGIRMSVEMLSTFAILEIRLGVEPVLTIAPDGRTPTLDTVRDDRSLVLERGMDFSVKARNDSDEPMHFECEVRGEPLE